MKWKKAKQGEAETLQAFQELSDRFPTEWIDDWKSAEREAAVARGNSLKVYDLQVQKRVCLFLDLDITKSFI
jgi:hypothetical protein